MTIKTNRKLNRPKAEIVRRFTARYGKCGGLRRDGRQWAFDFRLDCRRREAIMIWFILLMDVEVEG